MVDLIERKVKKDAARALAAAKSNLHFACDVYNLKTQA